eukprot:GHUV01038535.1.p1 GENE.GHUV01038535.1~~GHUV01038535.1.p1  ORF type:complete len:177 (+),score=26.65 GHUV01038535.1:208-738(+)
MQVDRTGSTRTQSAKTSFADTAKLELSAVCCSVPSRRWCPTATQCNEFRLQPRTFRLLEHLQTTAPEQQTQAYAPAWEVVDLLVPVHEVHEAIVVVVVMRTLGGVDRQLQVVGAQSVALCVSITEDTRLEQLVVTVCDTCSVPGRTAAMVSVVELWTSNSTTIQPDTLTAVSCEVP